MVSDFAKEFIQQSISRINANTIRIEKCLQELNEIEIWESTNQNSNSIANLVLHLCGNIRQYIVSALGGATDIRTRDEEFSTKSGLTKATLLAKLVDTVGEAVSIINSMDNIALMKKHVVQGFDLTALGIIIHVTEHYSYHTGQIAFWTKQLKNKDLRFYGDTNLNIKNAP